MRDARAPRAPDEKDSRDDEHKAPSEFIGKRAGQEGAHGASQQNRRNIEPGTEIGGMKSPVESIDRPINDTTIETKKKSTKRRHH